MNDGLLLSETAAQFTTVALTWSAYRLVRRPTLRRAAWLGLWCGLATLSRSELVFTVPFLLVPIALGARSLRIGARLKVLAVGVAVAGVVVAPWFVYNNSRFQERVLLSTNLGNTVAAANCAETYAGPSIGFKSYACASAASRAAQARNPDWATFDEARRDKEIRKEGLRYVRAHLTRAPVAVLARWGRMLELVHPFQEVELNHSAFKYERWSGQLMVVTFYPMFLLAIAGAVILRRDRRPLWPLLAVPAIVALAIAMTFAQIRYRSPAEISIVLLAAVALDRWSRRAPLEAPVDEPGDALAAPPADGRDDAVASGVSA